MKVYLDDTVVEKAYERMHYIFQTFGNVVCSVSGGKDSGVTLDIACDVSSDYPDVPLYCLWIDQEAEYGATREMVEQWMQRDEVEPLWLQIPLWMTNAAGHEVSELHLWDPELDNDEYVHPKHPMSIKENKYGTDKFRELFGEVALQEVDNKNDGETVIIGGVRCDESPSRWFGLTGRNTYNGITWGKKNDDHDGHPIYTFYPIYDWSWSDVWVYHNRNDLDYNDVYNYLYKQGVDISDMRVSHLHHQDAIQSVFLLQEFEPETYNRLVQRVDGLHSTDQLGDEGLEPDELPWMFADWREYRNFLLEKLIDDKEDRINMKKKFLRHDLMTEHWDSVHSTITRRHCRAILANDVEKGEILDTIGNSARNPKRTEIRDTKYQWLYDNSTEVFEELVKEGLLPKAMLRRKRRADPDFDGDPEVDFT